MSFWLDMYYRLPGPARSIAASMRGYYLKSWRYGPETEEIAQAALDREHWTQQQWDAYQAEKLGQLLHRAATKVPYYRQHWEERRRKGDKSSWDYLENWPILEKDVVRADPKAFVADDCDTSKMFKIGTSGTTGKPIDLWLSQKTLTEYYGIAEARGRYWYGVSRKDRWAIQGARVVVPITVDRPPFWVWNHGMNQLYMSSFHMTKKWIPAFLDAMEKHRVVFLYGYPQYLYVMAKEAIRLNRQVKMKVVIVNAEPLFDYQREVISKAFDCPVRETWGMSEIVANGGECEHQQLHLWPDVGIVEIMKDGQLSSEHQSGEFVCTGLVNQDQPLIRYRVGDKGTVATDETCPCGRTLPVLKSLDGRTTELVYLPDGRMINRFEPVFVTTLPLVEAQVIQDSLTQLRILYVPTAEFTDEHEAIMIQRARDRMGNPDVNIIAEPADAIPRTKAGKFQTIVCNLTPEERASIERGEIPHSAKR